MLAHPVYSAHCRSKLDLRILDVNDILSYLANLQHSIYRRFFLIRRGRGKRGGETEFFFGCKLLDIVRVCMNEINIVVTRLNRAFRKGFSVKLNYCKAVVYLMSTGIPKLM